MYVCICNGVTDTAIREAAADGVTSLAELTMRALRSGVVAQAGLDYAWTR